MKVHYLKNRFACLLEEEGLRFADEPDVLTQGKIPVVKGQNKPHEKPSYYVLATYILFMNCYSP